MSNGYVDVEVRERVAKLEQVGDNHASRIDKLEDTTELLTRLVITAELQEKNMERITNIQEEQARTNIEFMETLKAINYDIEEFKDNLESLSDDVDELKKVNVNSKTKDEIGNFNWIKFITEKAIPTIAIGVIVYFIFLITGVKL